MDEEIFEGKYVNRDTGTVKEYVDDNVDELNERIDREVETLNERINTEATTLNDRIDREVETLNERIDTEVDDLTEIITTEVNRLDGRIDDTNKELEDQVNRIDGEISRLDNKIDTTNTNINERIDTEVETLNTRIDNEVTTINNRITKEISNMGDTVTGEIERLDTRITNVNTEINSRIDTEVETLENSINETNTNMNTHVTNIGNRITSEVNTINNSIKSTNENLTKEVTRLDGRINTLDTKVDNHITESNTKFENVNKRIDDTNTNLTNNVNTINQKIATEVSKINSNIESNVNSINQKITSEVNTINNSISKTNTNLNDHITNANKKFDDINKALADLGAGTSSEIERIDGELAKVNKRIDDTNTNLTNSVNTINKSISDNVSTLNTSIKNLKTNIENGTVVAGVAKKVSNSIKIQLNGGTTEGTNQFTFDGAAAKTINITPSGIGAAAASHGTHLTLGETSSNAYRGDRGKTAYDHSQSAHAPSNAQKNSDITKAEIEAKLTGTITSHTHDYLPLSGGTVTGDTTFNKYVKLNAWTNYGSGAANFWYDGTNKTVEIETATDLKLAGTKVSKEGHTHNYLPLAGGTLTGATTFNDYLKLNAWPNYGSGTANFWYDGNNKTVEIETATDLKLNGTKVSKADHTHNSINTKGTNTINSKANDTTANWGAQGNSVHWYITDGLLNDQPSQWGYILNLGSGSEVHQIWATQASGNLAHRGGNASGWSGSWRTIIDSSNLSSYVPLFIRTSVGDGGWTVADNNAAVTVSGLAYWNGAYKDASSNLAYCNHGAFGSIVTKNSGDYATASHGHTTPRSGAWWNGYVFVAEDGVTEVGKYLDFHNASNDSADFNVRLTSNGSNLEASGGIKATNNLYAGSKLSMGSGGSDVYIHNSTSGKYLQLQDNGTLAYSDAKVALDGGTIGELTCVNKFTLGNSGAPVIVKITGGAAYEGLKGGGDGICVGDNGTKLYLRHKSQINIENSSYTRKLANLTGSGGVDIGDTSCRLSLHSNDNPIYWDGSKGYDLVTMSGMDVEHNKIRGGSGLGGANGYITFTW